MIGSKLLMYKLFYLSYMTCTSKTVSLKVDSIQYLLNLNQNVNVYTDLSKLSVYIQFVAIYVV